LSQLSVRKNREETINEKGEERKEQTKSKIRLNKKL